MHRCMRVCEIFLSADTLFQTSVSNQVLSTRVVCKGRSEKQEQSYSDKNIFIRKTKHSSKILVPLPSLQIPPSSQYFSIGASVFRSIFSKSLFSY